VAEKTSGFLLICGDQSFIRRKALNNKIQIMKKLAFVLSVAMVIGIFSSCKPKEKCPAYGKYVPSEKAAIQKAS
jgi:hypothetical protein